jgi:hypothetical protein
MGGTEKITVADFADGNERSTDLSAVRLYE